MAKRKKHSPEQIVRKLKIADELGAGGASGEEIARQLGISTATLYNWRNRYGAMNVNEAKELRRLRDENAKLKRLVAEKELDLLALKEIAAGNF
ncbi:MAG: putative transposase [Verrucomicrobiales bacterium]|jgi:putative transposase